MKVEHRVDALPGDARPRARILAEQDEQQLDRWTVRAASCTEAAELFIDG